MTKSAGSQQEFVTELAQHKDDIADTLFQQLRDSTASHYSDAEPLLIHQRVRDLLDVFCVSYTHEPIQFIDYVRGIAKERVLEGYRLTEILLALSLLEGALWQFCAGLQQDRTSTLRTLSRVSGTIGSAKDVLAHSYLDAVTTFRFGDTSRRVGCMFAGTESVPDQDE